MLQAAIWDVDGTLVDTAELHYQAWCAFTQENNLPFSRADFAATFGWRNREIMPKLWGVTADDEVQRMSDRKEDLYRMEASKGVELLPGVRRLLDELHAAGIPQGVGSSAPRRNLELILQITGTSDLFQAVVAMEDTRRGKPDPEVFLRVADQLKATPARCVVFEDAPAGVKAAKAGGMWCVGITFVGHHSADVLREAGADLVVSSLEQVNVRELSRLVGGDYSQP